ncbi:hypothetical protein ACHAW6_000656 [Cyclotella cf. meneghiniana]
MFHSLHPPGRSLLSPPPLRNVCIKSNNRSPMNLLPPPQHFHAPPSTPPRFESLAIQLMFLVQGMAGGLSHYHIIGTRLIFLAILISLTPAVFSLDDIVITKKDAIPNQTAYNTIVVCLAAIPSAMAQLYKEHMLMRI